MSNGRTKRATVRYFGHTMACSFDGQPQDHPHQGVIVGNEN
jgi:uncharacterized Zn-finger protein